MAYLIFSLSLLLIYVGLALLLHIQFGMLGIPNFGVVGFWGLGMYAIGVLQVQFDASFFDAMIVFIPIMLAVSYALGRLLLRCDSQSILCGTLAFSTIIALLLVTEKWLTFGVVGIGTIVYPIRVGDFTEPLYFLILLGLVFALQYAVLKLHTSRTGRLLVAIRDNEELAASLGKNTFQTRLIFFTITSTLMGVIGGLSAPINQFLTPNMIVPGITFAVWISLALGGKKHALGSTLGVFITFGLFDILIETYAPVSPEFAVIVPNLKLFLYGTMLVLILVYRPQGILNKSIIDPEQAVSKIETLSGLVARTSKTTARQLIEVSRTAKREIERQISEWRT